MSSLSLITTGSLWPSLQPKVSQTYFLQSWCHKSRWILQIWYIGGLLYTSRHNFHFFFSKIIFSEFWRLILRVLDFSEFSGLFFCILWHINLKLYTSSRWSYRSNSSFIPIGTLKPTFLQLKIGHFSAFMTSKLYKALRFGTHTYIVSVLTPTDFRHGWAIFGPLADKNSARDNAVPSANYACFCRWTQKHECYI